MTLQVIYLHPRASYRTPLRSDTLWGLLMVALRVVAGDREADAFIEACAAGQPPVRLSSAFPFVQETTPAGASVIHHFFPRPTLPPPSLPDSATTDPRTLFDQMQQGKKTKSIQWIPQALFEAVLQGELDEAGLRRALQAYRGPWPRVAVQDNLHTSIDRLTGTTRQENDSGQLFYSREFYLGRRQGLFFLCTGEVERLLPAIRYLHHTGWGGDSSVGKGHFDWQRSTMTLKVPARPTHRVLLSLYSPRTDELAHLRRHPEQTWYRLERRQGYAGAHRLPGRAYRKRPLYMLAEGTVVPDPGHPLCGTVHEVLTVGSVRVRHSGLALDVPACISRS
ncbi:type III-A CRISPR-associated RAMP protein Csm4 [Rhodothermus profundi]|uniref:CRISPR system Cms protein Csm4 n=1 Tax=Rhodothermus profundi TaxID=633813 RepID=A0A1M6SLL9_9BACT|nr:type III-A CRISPR-associated RAMP protein Csm4 [Rhodothermus profundi]SHK45537.1 CRISPR-associated protein Csm4 [Rhodothermus profundi]